MNNSGDQQGMNIHASGDGRTPPVATPSAPSEPLPPHRAAEPLGFFDHLAAFVQSDAGKVTLGILGCLGLGLAAAAITKKRPSNKANEDAGTSASDELDELVAMLEASRSQLDTNRRAGAQYERAVTTVLEEMSAGAEVWSQVTVTTPDGRTRRADNVLRHRNGAMTAVESKFVAEVTEEHVQQAEDHREGLRHTFGARAGKTILVVPEGALVRPEHEGRVRVRTFTP
jgi:hypothetical protein